jgi:hypothetical protein
MKVAETQFLPFGVYNPVVMIGRSYGKHIEGGV